MEDLPLLQKSFRRFGILPVYEDKNTLFCQMRPSFSSETQRYVHYLSQIYGKLIDIEIVDENHFKESIQSFKGTVPLIQKEVKIDIPHQLVQLIFTAYQQNCSDIHFEAHRSKCVVRVRKKGQLSVLQELSVENQQLLFNLIKLKAEIDMTDSRRPHDGQFDMQLPNTIVNCRVSTLPCLHGETIVIRLLRNTDYYTPENLGLDKTDFFQTLSKNPNGLWLITGPIGNGKTTTYYSILRHFKQLRVVSLEDPIEVPSNDFVQLTLQADLPPDKFVRNLLRQSVRIVGIGEIRDTQHLKMAVNAALTGHCVLATLHANSLASVTQRLENLGYDRAQQTQFLSGILFQSWAKASERMVVFEDKVFATSKIAGKL